MFKKMFDTHLHFFDDRYQDNKQFDLDQAITLANQHQVAFFCNVGTNLVTSKQALLTAKKYDFIFAACGYHPTMVKDWDHNSAQELLQLLKDDKVVAIGEIGLDFYHQYTSFALQKEVFKQQLLLAQKTQKPVLLHIREAYPEVLAIVSQYQVKGIVHCFSGTLAQAQQFIALGFFVSFSGVLTFANAKQLQTVAKAIPLQAIVLETDAPYLAPVPFRGQLNLPQYLLHTAQKLAFLKEISLDAVIQQTTHNAFQALQIKPQLFS